MYVNDFSCARVNVLCTGRRGAGWAFNSATPKSELQKAHFLYKSQNQLFYVTYSLAETNHRTRIMGSCLEFLKVNEELTTT
jgi:hypothetical protein